MTEPRPELDELAAAARGRLPEVVASNLAAIGTIERAVDTDALVGLNREEAKIVATAVKSLCALTREAYDSLLKVAAASAAAGSGRRH